MPDDSAVRIQISLRAALLAKSALEMINLTPRVALLQLNSVAAQLMDFEKYLKETIRR